MWRQQVWEVALADRAAGRVRAAEEGQPSELVDPARAVSDWEAWLAHDPDDTEEARIESRVRELMEVA